MERPRRRVLPALACLPRVAEGLARKRKERDPGEQRARGGEEGEARGVRGIGGGTSEARKTWGKKESALSLLPENRTSPATRERVRARPKGGEGLREARNGRDCSSLRQRLTVFLSLPLSSSLDLLFYLLQFFPARQLVPALNGLPPSCLPLAAVKQGRRPSIPGNADT